MRLPYRILNINHKKELLRGLWKSLFRSRSPKPPNPLRFFNSCNSQQVSPLLALGYSAFISYHTMIAALKTLHPPKSQRQPEQDYCSELVESGACPECRRSVVSAALFFGRRGVDLGVPYAMCESFVNPCGGLCEFKGR